MLSLVLLTLIGCGDTCEQACLTVSNELRDCIRDRDWSTTWEDLGADNKANFRLQCEQTWEQESTDLENREIQQALDSCDAINAQAGTLNCEEWRALYVEW